MDDNEFISLLLKCQNCKVFSLAEIHMWATECISILADIQNENKRNLHLKEKTVTLKKYLTYIYQTSFIAGNE